MGMADWEDQYRRVRRWLARIRNPVRRDPVPYIDYEDYLFAFFQNCWHLKDWVYNDTSLPVTTRQAIVRAAKHSPTLNLCYDIATRSKHLVLRKPQLDARVIGAFSLHLADSTAGQSSSREVRLYLVTESKGRMIPADGLAKAAVATWRQILTKNGLKPPRK